MFVFKVLLKVLLALGAVFAAVAAFQYFIAGQADYIEVYNDGDEDDGEYY